MPVTYSTHIYKETRQGAQRLHIYATGAHPGRPRPAIVFYFGGGWLNGDIEQFRPQCEHFAELGLVAVAAEYRIGNRHGTSALESVRDARCTIRWLRRHHEKLDLDPTRVCAAGGSAGGHLALCTALPDVPKEGYRAEVGRAPEVSAQKATVVAGAESDGGYELASCRPDALILYNPVLDTTESGFGHDRMGGFAHELSPMHQLRPSMPPTLLLHGHDDETVPFSAAERFAQCMQAEGNRCKLVGYPAQAHGFFNPDRNGGVAYRQTLSEATSFLEELGFLTELPYTDHPAAPEGGQN